MCNSGTFENGIASNRLSQMVHVKKKVKNEHIQVAITFHLFHFHRCIVSEWNIHTYEMQYIHKWKTLQTVNFFILNLLLLFAELEGKNEPFPVEEVFCDFEEAVFNPARYYFVGNDFLDKK